MLTVRGRCRRPPIPLLASSILLGLATLLLPARAPGQEWQGTARASGVVEGPEGEPIPGAAVILRWLEDPDQGPAEVRTDDEGRWAVLGLSPGSFLLTIRAQGYRESHGRVEVREGPTPPVEVTLQALAVETPRFSERLREDVLTWIETGNGLLESGDWAAARTEYEKALKMLRGPSRAEVLRAVARTHYMEGAVGEAIASLEEALAVAPADEDTRVVYRSLMQGEGRAAEAEEFLRELDAGEIEPPQIAPGSPESETAAPRGEPVAVEIEPGRTGRFRTGFSEGSPLSDLETLGERLARPAAELARAGAASGRYDLRYESFEVFVPKSYSHGDAADWGLVVWVSPTDSGRIPNAVTEAALEDSHLLWVGADASGNQRLTWDRIRMALDAAHAMALYYDIDPERRYAAGYSGGGRVASALTMLFPEVFRGGLFLYGVDFYRRVPAPDRPGSDWVPWFPPPPKSMLEQMREQTRLVLVTGERDFNRLQVETFAARYREEGFEQVTYIEIPGAGHSDWPSGRWLRQALEALDPGGR